jgi:hypothetical protein
MTGAMLLTAVLAVPALAKSVDLLADQTLVAGTVEISGGEGSDFVVAISLGTGA